MLPTTSMATALLHQGDMPAPFSHYSAETTQTPLDEENSAMPAMPVPLMFFERRLTCSF